MDAIHILNGDSLVQRIKNSKIQGEIIVCRECLIEGPSTPIIDDAFWQLREDFISQNNNDKEDEYRKVVVDEFERLTKVNKDSEINLWFENDLFCQTNFWFVIKYLSELELAVNLYRVFPIRENTNSKWITYGRATEDELINSFGKREKLTRQDVELGLNLWNAYASRNFDVLSELSKQKSKAFNFLEEVVQAHIDRYPKEGGLGRPERTLKEIIKSGLTDFKHIFPEFFRREEIYGFGDTQVESMLKRLK